MIRAYIPSDLHRLLQIFKQNTPKYFAPEEHKDLLHYLENEIDHYFVFEEDGKIKGSGGYNLNENGSLSISWDLVDPSFQGKGIGQQLLEYRLKHIRSHYEAVKLIVRTSQFAFGFYHKFGFTLKEVIKDYWSNGYDLCYMERAI